MLVSWLERGAASAGSVTAPRARFRSANCCVHFDGTSLEVRALESVEEGEEITFAYYDWVRERACRSARV